MKTRRANAKSTQGPASTRRRSLHDVRAAFEAVVDKNLDERARELDRICLGHPDLRRELDALLEAADRTPEPNADASDAATSADRRNDGASHEPPRLPGFAPLHPIGRGGMGEVFSSRRLRDQHPVAIKFPHRDRDLDEQRQARFSREAMILDRLDHPGIVRLLGRGTHQGSPFLVLELVDGGRPIDRFAAESELDLAEIVALVHTIADSIAHAHALGFVHRDLKPANILVDRDGRPRLLDFGIAKVEHRELEVTILHTGAEQVLGSLEAMSPEQTRAVNAPVDARSDIYQLGLVLHRLASPRAIPSGGQIAALARLRAIARSVQVAPIDGDPRLSRPLRQVLHAALRCHPDDRYQRMSDFSQDLRSILDGRFRRPTAPGACSRAAAKLRRLLDAPRRRW